MEVGPALAVVAAHVGAALQGAVPSIPAGDTETGPVLTLAVLLTPEHRHLSEDHRLPLSPQSYLASQSLF